MRKQNVWKQALALVLSAALMVGNGSSVFAAARDTDAGNAGAATDTQVSDDDAYSAIVFTADGEMVSGDNAAYTENGITFTNNGVTVVDAPVVSGDDGKHGKVFKFDKGEVGGKTTGIDYLTTADGAFAKYDYSNGVTFSMDICPEAQTSDFDYLFAFGVFFQNNVTGTTGFVAAYENPGDAEWTPFFPTGNWVEGNNVNSDLAFFNKEENAGKWYKMDYVYTKEGLTIKVDGVPAVTYLDTEGRMETILKEMSKGKLRIGKGIIETLEGYFGYMDNITIAPVPPHKHVYAEGAPSEVIQEPTCTEDGLRRMSVCLECGVIPTEIIPKLGHNCGDIVPAKEATCTVDGNVAYWECATCKNYFVEDETAEDGKKLTSKNKVFIKAAHKYGDPVVTKATEKADGVITQECSVCSKDTENHVITVEIIYKASNITLAGGTSYTYTGKEIKPGVTVKDSEGTVIAADNYTVTYKNNKNVGKATATITFEGDKYQGTVDREFTINEAASLTLDKSKATLYTGKASNTVTVKVKKVTGASKTVKWTTDNKKVATVKNGKITAVGKGTTTIRAKANGITKTVKVTVKNPTITVKNGKKKASSVTVKKGKKATLTVTTNPKKAGSALKKLSAKDKKVANVTYKKGKITIKGKKKGNITLKITSGKATKTIKVKVK